MICCGIVLYCLFAVLFLLNLRVGKVSPQVKAAQTEVVQDVQFSAMPDTPDPNQVFDLVNKVRVAQGSKPLVANSKLGKVASVRANDMAKRQYYAHKNPDGKYYYDFFPENSLKTDYSCENLDIVFVPDANMFINEWLASTKGHRQCMINPDLTHAGYAVTKMMLLQYDGKEVPAYLVVAVHTTDLN